MHDFESLNAVIGTPEMLARGKRYDPAPSPSRKTGNK